MRISDPIALSAEDLDRLIAELGDPARPRSASDGLVLAQALGVRFDRDQDPGVLDAALAAYRSCGYHGPERGTVGRFLVLRWLQSGVLGRPVDPVAVRELIGDAGDDPAVPGAEALLSTMVDLVAVKADDPGYDRDAALRRLDEAAAVIPPDSAYGRVLPGFRVALAVTFGAESGHYAQADAAVEYARGLLAAGDLGERQRQLVEAMLAGAEGLRAAQQGEMGRADESIRAMGEIADLLPEDDPAARSLRRLVSAADGTATEEDAAEPGLSDAERAWRLMVAATGVLRRAVDAKDAAGLDRSARMLREAAAVAPAGNRNLPVILSALGQALCLRFALGGFPATRGRALLDEARSRLLAAQRLTAHPGHPAWASTTMSLGLLHRVTGNRAGSRAEGRRGLRGHAWSVLLQAGTAQAASAARNAADDARQVARWCLEDGDPAGAASALEAGRCLLLYAATVTMDIPERLRGMGRDDLLARWGQDPQDADLRAEVLSALTGEPLSESAVPDVLDPPSPEDVGRALADLRFDVLAYLLPADDQGPGAAVLVPADGLSRRPVYLPLPRLAGDGPVAGHVDGLRARAQGETETDGNAGGPVAGDVGGLAARDLDAADGVPVEDWRANLDRLCDWAWPAAAGPLLDVLERWDLGRAPRIALVPMGALAAVPWHAARDSDGTRAVQVATFSYATSARLLCQNAGRPPVTGPALIVGDPTGDLPDAHAEATAIRAAFQPGATLLDAATATPDAVRRWLLDGGGGLLHLACHGAVRPGVDGSHLRLAGGARLTARDLLGTRRFTGIGLVALAACTTGVPSGAYDEAFSLATAFLASGARSVFGSLWPVPSDATSLLMFMAHHFVWAAGKRPVDALNHAQRWMLDPDRTAPDTMPPALAARMRLLDADDVTAWAGFTHHGR